jgi:hypothetical protein
MISKGSFGNGREELKLKPIEESSPIFELINLGTKLLFLDLFALKEIADNSFINELLPLLFGPIKNVKGLKSNEVSVSNTRKFFTEILPIDSGYLLIF